jgi:hypothetical protein
MVYVCERCREQVAPDATVCPHCGYDPGAELNSRARWCWGIGALLCLTVIGGVIGVPLVIWGFVLAGRIDDATPAVEAAQTTATADVTPS